MKQKFTHYFKSIILAIAFLLSGGIPANSQYLYLVDKNNYNGSSYDNKTDVSGLEPPFYLIYGDEQGTSYVIGGEYTLSKQAITLSIANRQSEFNEIPSNALKLNIDENESSRILCCNLDLENNKLTIAVHDMICL